MKNGRRAKKWQEEKCSAKSERRNKLIESPSRVKAAHRETRNEITDENYVYERVHAPASVLETKPVSLILRVLFYYY